MSSTNLLGKIGEIMLHNCSNQEDDWMVVILDSIFYDLWNRNSVEYTTVFSEKNNFQ
jgi:hypothetical protein